jgi:serine/threonine-protein kinase/endoribonuclease IRE1
LKNKNEYLSYKSPEILKNCKASKEDDIYSFDCIIYFVLSKGKHPFNFDTSKDVLENKKDLSALENSKNKDENQIYLDLITNMIKLKRTERPTIQNVLNHPMFWNIEKVLNFFRVISNLFPKFENHSLPKSLNIKSGKRKSRILSKT